MTDAAPVERLAFIAGVLSTGGEFRMYPTNLSRRPRLELVVSSSLHEEAITRIAEMVEEPVRMYGKRYTVVVKRMKFDILMEMVWPYLTYARQVEYNALVARYDQALAEWNAIRARKKVVPLSHEQRMARREAAYDNSDPAVQVIPEVTADDTVMADVTAAKAARERLHAQMVQGMIKAPEIARATFRDTSPIKRRRRPRKKG